MKINFFNLVITRNIEKAFKAIIIFIKVVKKRINILKYYINNVFHNNNNKENNNKNIIKII